MGCEYANVQTNGILNGGIKFNLRGTSPSHGQLKIVNKLQFYAVHKHYHVKIYFTDQGISLYPRFPIQARVKSVNKIVVVYN